MKTVWKVLEWLFFSMLLFLFYFNGIATAEGYGDYYLYNNTNIHKNTLIDTIGIVVLYAEENEISGTPQPSLVISQFQGYKRNGDIFSSGSKVSVDDIFPVGKGGWGGWIKFLITASESGYIQVIIDPYKNDRCWVKPAKKDQVVIYPDLSGVEHSVQEEIDIFMINSRVNFYPEPREGSISRVLHKNKSEKMVFYPIRFTTKYVQVGRRYMDQDHTMDIPGKRYGDMINGKPLGWIRMRDSQDRIAFHLFTYSWY